MSTPLNGSVLKAFSILHLISPEQPEISASSVASALGINNATAHRFLLTLEEAGALISYRRGYFSLGPAIEALGAKAEAMNQTARHIRPLITNLADTLNESVMVCRLGRGGPTCIAVAPSKRSITVNISVGTVLPIARSAQGKLFLAAMSASERASWLSGGEQLQEADYEAIRQHGYARNIGESEADIGALSVPVKDRKNNTILTLSVFGMLSRIDDDMVAKALPQLLKTAHKMSF